MGWFRRPSRLIYDTFRCYNLKNTHVLRNPSQEFSSISITKHFCTSSSKPNFIKSRFFEYSQPIFRNPILQNCVKQQNQLKSPFLDGAKRFYFVDKRKVHHFKRSGWFRDPRNVFIVVIVSSGVILSVYFGNLETVPYTKRTHFVLLSQAVEKELGEKQFNLIKEQYKGKILPPLHPDCIRVQQIARDIIGAVQRGMRNETEWSDTQYSPESVPMAQETPKALIGEEEKWHGRDSWKNDDEMIDDKWIQQCRKRGQEKEMKSQTGHLEGLKWELIVVNEPQVNAFCAPGGKIVVFTGLLNHFKADAEIATVIGHEVGHAVARHSAEQMSKNLWVTILQLIFNQFFMPDVVSTMSTLLLRLPFSRRMEMEADYIGLLLLASAGYDPRVAPQVYEKLGKITGESVLQDYVTTHPSAKKRAQALSHAKVMEEALDIYRDLIEGREDQGFL